jgi:hypothetical protein
VIDGDAPSSGDKTFLRAGLLMRFWNLFWFGRSAAGTMLSVVCLTTQLSAASPYNDAVLADGPIVYWTFDEASGNAIEQINGVASAELAPMGTATRGASTSTFGGVALGSAAVFDGTLGGRFQATDVVPGNGAGAGFIASQRWAVEFWVNLGSTNPTYISEMFSDCCENDASMIAGFMPGFEMFSGGRTGNAAPVPLSTNTWHHVVAAFYGNSTGFGDNLREIYVDGVLALSDTTSNFSSGHGLNALAIGNAVAPSENAQPLMVDEYAIYELPGSAAPAGALSGDTLLADQLFVEGIASHAFTAVPEPSTVALCAMGVALLAGRALRRRSRQ